MSEIENLYLQRTKGSKRLYDEAKSIIPGGVTHNTRYYRPYPLFIQYGKGSKLVDVDGNTYVDFWCGHGSLIFGHAFQPVTAAIAEQAARSTHYGICNELEVELARKVVDMVPNAEMVRFPNTGTEAALYAIRLARAYTRRGTIVKFAGAWHGGYDALHIGVKPPFEMAGSMGITEGSRHDTVVIDYNDLQGAEHAIKKQRPAAVIVEPVLGGSAVAADKDFLKGLRETCTENGTVLIFDEVVTGFRLAPGGAQEFYDVTPDLAIFGKILGGGLPIGGIVGPREIMALFDLTHYNEALVYQGGTFCGNPMSMTAGLTVLRLLDNGKIHQKINKDTARLKQALTDTFERMGVSVQVPGGGSIFNVHFSDKPVRNANDVFSADRELLRKYHLFLITRGVMILPHHMALMSNAHSEEDINKLIAASEDFAKNIAKT